MDVNNIIADFQLLGTTILFLNIENSFVHIEKQSELEKSMDVEYEILNEKEDDNMRFGKIRIYVNLSISSDEDSMDVKLVLEGAFMSSLEISKETFHEFLSLNACATLYSIARSIITSITSQTCSGGQLILPMINVFKIKEEKEEIDSLQEE